jgi:hypothetical protein
MKNKLSKKKEHVMDNLYQYRRSYDGFELIVDMHDDKSGYYALKKNEKTLQYRNDAQLQDWIDDLKQRINELEMVRDFLELVKNKYEQYKSMEK